MKTFARLIRRYVLATAGIILVVVALLLGMTIYAGVRYNGASDSVQKVGALAEALHPTADGLQWDAAHTPAEWMHGYAWAMVLDEDGNVIWQQDLPEALNHRYTASDIAVFSRWYLADYPVQCWAADYGLFVAAEPVGSQWKYNITAPQARMEAMVGGLLPVAVLLLAVVLGVLPVVQLARGTPFAGGGRRAGHFSPGRRSAAAHHRLCRGAGRKAERDRRAAAPPQ